MSGRQIEWLRTWLMQVAYMNLRCVIVENVQDMGPDKGKTLSL